MKDNLPNETIPTMNEDFLTLARLALNARPQDVGLYLSKVARKYRTSAPEFTSKLAELLREGPNRSSPLRQGNAIPLPVDSDSRLNLLRLEHSTTLDDEPILNEEVASKLNQLIAERTQVDKLLAAGLSPSRAVLFVGPPGVGKTLSARWIATKLKKPLLILDLSAVMSSLLGKTGNNIRAVIDYAKSQNCILFLDELDAVAKRRDDSTEIGELKRLVTVLLQEIDDWPETSLLMAATNHPNLLDPAVWRRFDSIVNFGKPNAAEVRRAISTFLGSDLDKVSEWVDILSIVLEDSSYSDIEKVILTARRRSLVNATSLGQEFEEMAKQYTKGLSKKEKIKVVKLLSVVENISQRRLHEVTGVSRDTIRKVLPKG